MAIKVQHLISAHCTAICIRNEVIKAVHSNLICGPPFVANIDPPVTWKGLKLAFLGVFYCSEDHI